MRFHPLAIVNPAARIDRDVEIGPFCVVEADVVIGEGCRLETGAIVKNGVTLGRKNHLFEGAVIGGPPQHLQMPERSGRVVIGSGNTIRENVTIHRAMREEDATLLGDDNLLMVNAHVAHDCRIGDQTIFANNVLLAGHVCVADRVYFSGAVAVHQFCRIGTMAMVGGQAHIVQDVPPFVTVDGVSSCVVGLNRIGLRRAGYQREEIKQLKAAYQVIFRAGLTWNEILARLEQEHNQGAAAGFLEFLADTSRGLVKERRLPPGATIRLHRHTVPDSQRKARVG